MSIIITYYISGKVKFFSTVSMSAVFKKIRTFICSVLFPSSANIARIERMCSEEIERELPKQASSPYPFISSVFNYRNNLVREIVFHIKYRGDILLMDPFGEILYKELEQKMKKLSSEKFPVLVIPIPLSKKRFRERGFNQSELLGRSILKHDKKGLFALSPSLLERTKDTSPQTKLKRGARLKNVKGCFSVPEEQRKKVEGKNIVLVDDVSTTGSTLKEARLELLRARAKEVSAITLAH